MPSGAIETLGTLVIVALIVERALAFIFEHEWFKKRAENKDGTSKRPGLKGLLALIASLGISFGYGFDVLGILLGNGNHDTAGRLVTGFVIAGGSSGALALFQGYLGIGKDARDAIMAAKIAKADSVKQVAKLNADEAQARLDTAKAEKKLAEAQLPPDPSPAG